MSRRKLYSVVLIIFSLLVLGQGYLFTPAAVHATPVCNATDVSNKQNYESDTVYELMTDRFSDGDTTNNNPYNKSNSYDSTHTDINKFFGGDWQGVINNISYLKNLGVTAIWITAPYNNLDDAYFQSSNSTYYNAYHGYWAKDYFVPDEHWGNWAKFDSLVSTAHTNGIKVIIDYAPNHTNQTDSVEAGGFYRNGVLQGRWNADTNGYFHHLGNRGDSQTSKYDYENRDLANLADFSTENGAVQNYLTDSIDVWLSHGVDGIRNDATLHQSDAFRTVFADHVNSNSNPVFHFGEYFVSSPDPKYDDYRTSPDRTGIQILDFELANIARGAFGDFSKTMEDLKNTINYTANDYTYETKAVTWLDSHDKERIASLQPNRGIEHAALAFLLTSRGTPVIYYGTEQYLTGINGDAGRVWMSSFDQTTTAFKLIKKLSDLRKSNPAIDYGDTTFRWDNNDVLVYERKFYNNIVMVAVNRSGTTYNLTGLLTSLPNGSYSDYLGHLLSGHDITVSGGAIPAFNLGPSEVSVWQYKAPTASIPEIGAVGSTMGRSGDLVTIDGDGFGGVSGTVNFGTTAATIQCWANNEIKVNVPGGAPTGVNNVTVVTGGNTSNTYTYTVLGGAQVQVIFHENATTTTGQNIYVVGNIYELGNWDATKPYVAFWNPSYPNWYLPVSVPAGTTIQFKFVKRDGVGNITWEGGSNHSYTTPASGAADTPSYTWQP
ncbi:MAG: alpha-amylase [Candidatus Chloroheliales bacterium]|nr:MAG: alpha-amylase [Chloroflexota bacterium]